MANRRFSASTPTGGKAVANSGADITVLAVVAPSAYRVKVRQWSIFFDGIVVTNPPIQVRVVKATLSAGTAVPVTLRELCALLSGETIQSTANSYTAEPTYTGARQIFDDAIHPQQGYCESYPYAQEIELGPGEALAIVVNNPAGGATVNARANIVCEE